MRIIVVANQKGGVGKSTIACNLAICSVKNNLKTLLIDTDPQASSLSFRAIRKNDDLKAIQITQATIHKDIVDFNNFETVIVDAGGKDNDIFRSAILAAAYGILFVPILPSQYDIWAAQDTFKVLEIARTYTDIKCCTSFNRVITNTKTKITKEAQQDIEKIIKGKNITRLETMLYNRVDYSNSISEGLGVIEYAPNSKAAIEIKSLYNEILQQF